MSSNTTLKKISQILDISISTVSRALKNHPDISEGTKKKVMELASTLEYEPNTYAIQLRTNNSKAFGLIVPSLSNFFYDSFIASVEEECRNIGYTLLILQSGDDPAIEVTNLKLCKQNRVSGIFACITPTTTDIVPFLKVQESNIPVIFFDKVPSFEACNKVCLADAAAAKLAAETIIQKKKKKVLALFGDTHLSITQKRLQSFTDTFNREWVEEKPITCFTLTTEEAHNTSLHYLKSTQKPDVIFCMSDEILIGTMKAIQQLGLHIPGDISVIALSTGFFPGLYHPEITYVETSGYKLGKLAITRMMGCLSGSTFIQELTLESILVEGGSL